MDPRIQRVRFELLPVLLTGIGVAACGADDLPVDRARGAAAQTAHADIADQSSGAGTERSCEVRFDSSYAAIQALIFERHGCTASACHGQAKVGGLDLRADASWESLVDVASTNSKHPRIQPGVTSESYLYAKLLAGTKPGSVEIAGSPMPVGGAPLSERELEALALWIQKGAPKSGNVGDAHKDIDVGKLLDACLPPVTPPKIKPLDPPAAGEGVQFRMPRYALKGNSEVEHCTPFAYDFSARVPAAYKDEARGVIFVSGSRVRQDPQSHHLTVWNPKQDLSKVAPDGSWTCNGGARAAEGCDPRKGSADCGDEGVCVGKTTPGTFCGGSEMPGLPAGFDITALADPARRAELLKDPAVMKALQDALKSGALGGLAGGMPEMLANAQSPQENIPPMDGVYWEIPIRGVMWFNSHAFNLEDQETELDSRVNFYFARSRVREMKQVTDTRPMYVMAGQAPFTRKSYCAKFTAPQGQSLAFMTGHTHRRGERFWVNDPSGKLIYESLNYADPLYKHFEPFVQFDSADPALRTIEYCATYNNGLTKDDRPDLNLVTRASRMPDRTSCKPVACVAGKVTAACSTDRDCDSSPGRGDGSCDACAITAGATTENEMFALAQWYVAPPK